MLPLMQHFRSQSSNFLGKFWLILGLKGGQWI